jgi:hypothetical protein
MTEIRTEIDKFTIVFKNSEGVRTQLEMKGGFDPMSKVILNYEYREPVFHGNESLYFMERETLQAVSLDIRLRKEYSMESPVIYTLTQLPEETNDQG